jgi:hypothetical protein
VHGRHSFAPVAPSREMGGRGSWIRTNDLQYPKLPRYQAALCPEIFLFEHDLRANATRLSRGKTGFHPRIKSEGMLFRIMLWETTSSIHA